MFPVLRKSRIPHTESYPLRAGEISKALADVPQAGHLRIDFWRYVMIRDREKPTRGVIEIVYRRSRAGISTPNYAVESGGLGPQWQITVSPVVRSLRHTINALLVSEGLPKLRKWLIVRKDLHGKFTHEKISVLYNEESQTLEYE